MNEIELKKLWDKLQGKINVGTFVSFKSKMDTAKKRKLFFDKYYEKLKNDYNLNLGEYDDFEKRLSGIVNPPPNPNQQTQTSGLPTWTTNYPCLSDRGTIIKTTLDNQVKYKSSDGDNEFFFKSFYYQFNSKDGKKIRGTWECKNGTLFIKTDDGEQWQKSTGWVDQPRTNSGNTIKRSKYTKCPETVVPPLKQWCKNETIRKVQACLKMPKRFLTGNFGQNTQEYLESRGQNGTLITTETIVNVCGANHPLVKDLGISVPGVENKTGIGATGGETTAPGATGGVSKPESKTGYEDYSFDEIESGNQPTKDEDTDKPATQKNNYINV
jgi:hypothetical protein